VAATPRLALRVRRRARRSHAERRAETRAKILAAVVDAIAEQGFQRATAQQIAGRAGVTWGAVQHHFGGKDGLMLAVLEESFNGLAVRLADVPIASTTLAERAGIFVDRAWEHFSGRHYRATLEIMLSYLGRPGVAEDVDWRRRMLHAFDALWTRLFAGSRLSHQRSLALQRFTVSALSGLASTHLLAGAGAAPKRELAVLKEVLVRELGS